MTTPPVLCDFCRKPRDESHDMLACADIVDRIADMNNLRKLERLISRLTD